MVQTITVTNRGNLAAKPYRPIGPGPADGFTMSTNCGPPPPNASIAPGASCTITFSISRSGPYTGKVVMLDTANSPPPGGDLLEVPLVIEPPTPTPTPIPTPRGSIFLNPASATPGTKVTLSGSGLDPSAILHVLFDSNPTIDINTNPSGNFTAQLTVPDTAPAGTHQVCVGESNGNICSAFTVEAAPASTPSPSPSPSVSPSPSPSDGLITIATTTGGGTSPLALLIKPPFVFLPIIAAIALLAFLGIYLWRLRQAPPISEVTILHKAPEPRPYGHQDPIPPPTPAPPPPAAPIVYESPGGPISAPPPARPPAAPNNADIPPEMPEASD